MFENMRNNGIPLEYAEGTLRVKERMKRKKTQKITIEIKEKNRVWLDDFFKKNYPEFKYTLTELVNTATNGLRATIESGVMPFSQWRDWPYYYQTAILKEYKEDKEKRKRKK